MTTFIRLSNRKRSVRRHCTQGRTYVLGDNRQDRDAQFSVHHNVLSHILYQ